jgi:lysine/ornithine N-monooxygenase
MVLYPAFSARRGIIRSVVYGERRADHAQKVVVVGASVSAADIAYDITTVTNQPVYAVIIGHNFNTYFGDEAFKHPRIVRKPSITHITTTNGERTVHFKNSPPVTDVDEIIFGTGYSWTLPFLPQVEVRHNRVPGLYQHVVYIDDPSLLFVGAVGAGLTFKVFEWQAVYASPCPNYARDIH